jgi:hypothetical protein
MTETATRRLPRPLALVLAPALWLERARGRRRLVLASLYLLALAAAGALAWRASRLNGLPDIGEPFDARPMLDRRVPDDRNAYVLYRKAHEALHNDPDVEKTLYGGATPYAWRTFTPAESAYLEANAEAMRLWRLGTERPEAQYYRLADLTIETPLDVVDSLRNLGRMAMLEASRCESRGDMAGSWGWYRATLRSGWHCGAQGTIIERFVGYAMHVVARSRILPWAADPRVDAPLLRRALADLRDVEGLATPISGNIRAEYVSASRQLRRPERLVKLLLDHPDWRFEGLMDGREWTNHLGGLRQATWFLQNEPERSRRLLQLAFANTLAYCDLPPGERPPMLTVQQPGAGSSQLEVFDAPIPSLPAARAVSPAFLKAQLEGAGLARILMFSNAALLRGDDSGRATWASLVVGLARELYARERGHPPESASALVGPYLDRLPDGYVDPPADPDRKAP